AGARDPRGSASAPITDPLPAQEKAHKPVERTGKLLPAPELTLSNIYPKVPLRPLFWVLPILAALVAGFVVFAVGYFGGADVQLTSTPPGAKVVVDGRPAPSVTPVLITGLDPDAPHTLQVEAPGMKVWTEQVSLQRGATITVHAELEPLQ
ncbi:MAG TPA: PEGA domain-containing protein, partial [Myxococcaceae bacterium]